jgi:hypothetical protein
MPEPLQLLRRLRHLVLPLSAMLCACEPPPPQERLDGEHLRIQVRQLASLSAEAELFVQELSAGHLSGPFAWVHQQALGSEVRGVIGALAQPATEDTAAAQREANALGSELQLQLTQVAPAREHPHTLRALQQHFSALQRQLHAIGGTP